MTQEVLENLFTEVKDKIKNGSPNNSYSAFLASLGLEKINQKIIEEAKETAEAALEKNDREVILESADLIYHLLVLLAYKNIEFNEILAELQKRNAPENNLSAKAIAKNKKKLLDKNGK